ncbi:MAG TPA: MBL fold metallo-hydrolase [Terriglobales bacterium]|nr:MBL fold metallo-hydrolase [Terriglobales bacterium]
MRVVWLGHACFLIEGAGLRLLTDPYQPEVLGLPPIREQVDVVIRSSADDRAHGWVEGLPGAPRVVTATEVGPEGAVAAGLRIDAIPAQESLEAKAQPRDNAMYRFALEGVAIGHFGDVGNAVTPAQLARLRGIEVALVPVGGPPTIGLADLRSALRALRPALVIPMHYRIPGAKPRMLPVTEFTALFPAEQVEWRSDPVLRLERTRPGNGAAPRILVLPPQL